MTYDGAERFAHFLAGLFIGMAVIFILLLLTTAVVYVLQSLALYRMAKNAGFPSPVLAWIPVASSYLLGLLCERASCCRSGKSWKFSVILPVVELLSLFGGMNFLWSWNDFSLSLSSGGFLGLVGTVVTAFALYNLYWDYAQGREVLYTVLSVVFGGLGQPVILFLLRDRVPISVQGQGFYGYPGYPGPPPYQSDHTTGWDQPPGGASSYQYPPYPQYPQDPRGPEDKNP